MPNISPEQLQLGAVAIIFLFFLKEFFAYLKSRKDKNGTEEKVLSQVTLISENHLNSILKAITDGNQNIVNAISTMDNNLGDKIDSLGKDINRLIGRGDK